MTQLQQLRSAALIAVCALLGGEILGQELDRGAMLAELTRLAKICNSLDLETEARVSLAWLPAARGDQRTLYLPTEPASLETNGRHRASWATHFNSARSQYAAHLFEQARSQSDAGREADAFCSLWHVLREDASHAEARRILGPLASAVTDRPRLVKGRTRHPEFGWPAGSYSRIQTPHFTLTTRAEAKESLELAARMEAFYAIWRQVYYPLWALPNAVSSRFAGRNVPWEKSRELAVYLLKDREDYLQVLGVAEANADISVGYYHPQARKSFFYSDPNLDATLFHELTHQLLAEATSIDARPDAGDAGGMWLLEGIALYMESLTDHGHYWTVGGIDSPRLQTSRYRAVRDGYWIDWKQFTRGTKQDWKRDPQIARLYTQAVGVTHLFMDQLEQPRAREALFKSLVSVYQNNPDASLLLELLGGSNAEAQGRYQQSLTLTDADIESLTAAAPQLKELVLAGSELSAESWSSLAELRQLQWFDASFSNAKSADLMWLRDVPTLERLSVEGTYVDGTLLQSLKQLQRLKELDVSGCAVDDQSLAQLAGNNSLETLWLTKTQITEEALETLATLPRLRYCNVDETQITTDQWQAFLRKHPQLSLVR